MSESILGQYFIALLITGIINLVLCFLVISRGFKRRINQIFALYSLSLAVWSIFEAFGITRIDESIALLLWRINHVGVIFIPVFLTHFIFLFLHVEGKKRKFIPIYYVVAFLFLLLNTTPLLILNVVPKFSFRYFINPGYLYYPFFALWIFGAIYGNIELLKEYFRTTGYRKQQMKYFCWALLLSYIGGVPNFLPTFNIEIPGIMPYGTYAIPLYAMVAAYSIIRYHLFDIKLVITRAGIFIFVYTLVLGIPFYCAYSLGLWKYSLWLMMVLATTGPFIYLYLQKKAEEQLLIEQHQYQTTLKQASLGMGQIKELGRLLKLIVHIVTRVVEIEHSEIYLLHEDSKQFTLKASRGWSAKGKEQLSVISPNSPMVNYLKETNEPLLYEEIEQYVQDDDIQQKNEIQEIIEQLDGSLVVPSFMGQKLIAILVLGKKKSGKVYTQDDMAVFSILANQAGLAIENAQFYEKMKETHFQLLKAEKMATVGTMADGLSHQINNRLHAMGFIAGDAIDTIKLRKKKKLSPDMKKFLDGIEHSLKRIEDNVKRGGEIVEGLLKYTRKGSEGFEAIDLSDLLDASFEMAQFKIKVSEMNVVRSFNGSIPKIKGNFTQLQEVFFNIIDNAYDAMMQRKAELREPNFKAQLVISAKQMDQKLEILIQDNGMGVKPENLEKLFTPFFTTKLSSKKGTGLGLYVIRQVIEENHGGKVWFDSQYQKGSQTRILLPTITGNANKQN